MKRFRRWLSRAFIAICLLLCATVLVLWYRSYHSHHVAWTRWHIDRDKHRLRTDYLVCDRGRLSWFVHDQLTWWSPEEPTIWRSYAKQDAMGWNYGFDVKFKRLPNIGQRLCKVRGLGFEFLYFGPQPDSPLVYTTLSYDKSGIEVAVPCSGLSLILGLSPVIRFLRFLRALRRRVANRCATCGYDLRGTPECCPECGTPAATAAASARA